MKLEFDELRALVMMSDELHFGRAATKLHVSQPALTKQIKRIEAKVGGRLFNRSTAGVFITASGAVIADRARLLIQEAEAVFSFAEKAAQGYAGTLRIGFGVATVPDLVPNSVRAFRRVYPRVLIEMKDMSTPSQVEALQKGSIDIGFVRLPRPEPDIQFVPVQNDELVLVKQSGLALDTGHGLPGLHNEPFIFISRSASFSLNNHSHELCRKAGFSPRVIQEAEELFTLLHLVRAGLGISLVPASSKRMRVPGLVFTSTGQREALWDIGVAWSRKRSSPFIEEFISVVKKMAPLRSARARRRPG